MTAATYNITIEQHQDFSRGYQITSNSVAVDLAGSTLAAQIRQRLQSETAWNFTVTVVDEAEGQIELSMADTLTATIPAGELQWDLVWTRNDGVKIRLLEGVATVNGGITR